METKILIKEKLREHINYYDKEAIVKGLLNSCANHIYDAYRDLGNAYQYVESNELRGRIEDIKGLIGNEFETSSALENRNVTLLSKLMATLESMKPDDNAGMYAE
jgi:hypothetical protein